jgi:hypothetical protein
LELFVPDLLAALYKRAAGDLAVFAAATIYKQTAETAAVVAVDLRSAIYKRTVEDPAVFAAASP